ncbi:type II toxin-antitoxin system PemK/MazF family toxin [Staphylococcus delphini]|uniref:type II toxin-antitoxin system PemK/MazF family toxin n=1 Tax=Staphylococcus delphini TaxID=53344 RepID=UPI0012D2E8B5|nr:type II toxin-antitoxin system PemK/MazF family toxin [Staphylococcus delphini]MTV23774.1 toxin MazF [Staphylococcus delphini]
MSHNIERRINKLKHSGNPKFKSLDSDMHYLIKRFEGEKNHKGFYPKFKQGEIIFVDFGINVNKEFSNSHFAIVMNKNDSNTEDTLNVVPLSSKENKKYLKMNLDLKWEYFLRLFLNLISSHNNIAKLKEDFDKKYSKDKLDKEFIGEFISDTLNLENKLDEINRSVNNTTSAMDKIKKLKGSSYACINSFQPISKFRVRKVLPQKIKNPVINPSDIMILINQINNNILQIPDIR